jgi:oligosaccharide repeat unit polymerase
VFAWAASAAFYLTGPDFLRARTVAALLVFYFAFVLASGYVLVTFSRRLRIKAIEPPPQRPEFLLVLLLLQGLALVASAAHLYYAFLHVGTDATLTEVRGALATQTINIPIFIRLLGQLRYINYFAPLAIFAMVTLGYARKRTLALSLLLACLYPVCYLERSGIMRIVLLGAFAYVYFSVNSFGKLLKLASILGAIMIPLVVVIPVMRGQAEGADAYNYVVGAWSGFDNFVSGSGMGAVAVLEDQNVYVKQQGYEAGEAPPFLQSATELYRICNAISACSVRLSNFFEYVYAPVYTNIYTLARTYYQDFGPVGAPIGTALFAAFLAFIYVMSVSGGGVFHVYVGAYVAYICAMSVLSDNFLMRDIVFTGVFIYFLAWFFGSRTFWFGIARRKVGSSGQTNNGVAHAGRVG